MSVQTVGLALVKGLPHENDEETSHCIHVKSHLTLKKRRPLWSVTMDDSEPTHERRLLVKTYKNGLPQKWPLVYEVCRET